MTATVQLLAITEGPVAVIQKDDLPPIQMSWGLLGEAQEQQGSAGTVYRWLMRELVRCWHEQRNGREWSSPRRTVDDIVAEEWAALARAADQDRAARAAELLERTRAEAQADRRREEELVAAERRTTPEDAIWWSIPHWEVPDGVRFDTLPRDQGQVVEISYGTFDRSEAGPGDPYMRAIDRSVPAYAVGHARYYRRRA